MKLSKRKILYFPISLLTFVLGVSLPSFWYPYTPESATPSEQVSEELRDAAEKYAHGEQESGELRIVGRSHACGPTANYHTYKLSDGGHISNSCHHFPTRAAAAKALRIRLGNSEITERGADLDESGQKVGETILTENPVQRLTISGRNLCVTEASSMEHLRWFERR